MNKNKDTYIKPTILTLFYCYDCEEISCMCNHIYTLGTKEVITHSLNDSNAPVTDSETISTTFTGNGQYVCSACSGEISEVCFTIDAYLLFKEKVGGTLNITRHSELYEAVQDEEVVTLDMLRLEFVKQMLIK